MELKEIKRCEYDNCGCVIVGRSNKKFCSDNCRKYFHIYRKRENERYLKEKNVIRQLIKEATQLQDKSLLDLYKIIYG